TRVSKREAQQRESTTDAYQMSLQEKAERAEREEQEKEARERGDGLTDDPNGRQGFRRLQMQDEKGEIPPDAMEKARRHVQLMKAAQLKRLKAGAQTEAAPQIGILGAGVEPD